MTFAKSFKALSDPERRRILELLKSGSMSAGEIASHFDTTAATISYHLKVLKQADLIFEKKEKNYIYYQLNVTVLESIMLWITNLKEGDSNVEKE
ncbi:MAG: autorepressor SdpR family transcription factor [Eubacteriales bacterium]|nr:autorepressor SdpR family transcription factor [Eubacteriales bacterium]MDY3332880.1 autorepressor SdpR family transcription factor [Gallibacter sp.]